MKRVITILFLSVLMGCNTTGSDTRTHRVKVNIAPGDAGTISPSPDNVYNEGQQISLQANPSDGYLFKNWGGDLSSSDNPYQFTVDQEYHLTANFEKKTYSLTVNTEGEGTVREEVMESSNEYDHGTIVQLTAQPADRWKFIEWQGALVGSNNPETIEVDGKKTVTAVFDQPEYSIDVTVDGEGSYSISPDKEVYRHGDQITIEVTPSSGWSFVYWGGDLDGTDNPQTITLENDITATATLDENPFAGGDGSQAYPYEVATIEQLQAINDHTDAHFIQINHIDASKTSNWNGGEGFKPIGDDVVPFNGTYDGADFKIIELSIDRGRENYVGLFGYVATEGQVKNTRLENITISGRKRVGGLIGDNRGKLVSNSHSSGTIDGGYVFVGGLIGRNVGELIISSSSTVDVSGIAGVGGLIGGNGGVLTFPSNTGEANINSNQSEVILRDHRGGHIKEVFAEGNVNGNNQVGGLVGFLGSGGNINRSYATGTVTGGGHAIGGLVGDNTEHISNSYAYGETTGDNEVGGLIGVNKEDGEVITSYSSGKVTGAEDIGGIIGLNGASIESIYWDTNTSGHSRGIGRGKSEGALGLSTSEMTGSNAEENMTELDWEEIWMTTDSYPMLQWESAVLNNN